MKKTKRIFYSLFLILTLLLCYSSCDFSENDDKIVYVTATGSSYHNRTCTYIKKAKTVYSCTRGEAKEKGYSKCKVCKP